MLGVYPSTLFSIPVSLIIKSSSYLLSSTLKCGHCGHNMIGEKKKHVSGKVYIRYVCGNYLSHKLCFYNFVHKDAIESLVFNNIKDILDT